MYYSRDCGLAAQQCGLIGLEAKKRTGCSSGLEPSHLNHGWQHAEDVDEIVHVPERL